MNIVIVGAGPGGLAAAWNAVQDGHHVIVLEKEEYHGGAASTFEKGGFRYDLGPHNFHPSRKSIIKFVRTNFQERLLTLDNPQVKIYFLGKDYNYPLGPQIFHVLPFFTTFLCGVSFMWQRLLLFLGLATPEDGSYKVWVTNRFGKKFYDIFFGPYTEKTWGFPATELSDTVAIKRIPVKGLSDLIRSLVFNTNPHDPKHSQTHEDMVNVYPKTGIGEISDFFVNEIKKFGGKIFTGCNVNGIAMEGKRVAGIHYSQGGQNKYIDFHQEGGLEDWAVISTAPITELLLMTQANLPVEVIEAARGLDYSSMVLLYLDINKPDVFGNHLYYFTEDEFPFNRVYDVGLFSRDMVPPGKNAICLEFSCTYKDDIWNSQLDQIFNLAITPLEKHGLLKRTDIESYHTRHLQYAYPRFRVGYKEKLRTIFNYIETVENLDTIGRQGLFSYANVDDVMWMAFQITKHLCYKDRLYLPLEELLPEYIDY
jgi:protoporphyrinogen oxidase